MSGGFDKRFIMLASDLGQQCFEFLDQSCMSCAEQKSNMVMQSCLLYWLTCSSTPSVVSWEKHYGAFENKKKIIVYIKFNFHRSSYHEWLKHLNMQKTKTRNRMEFELEVSELGGVQSLW